VLTNSLLALKRQYSKQQSTSSSQIQAAAIQLENDIMAAVARTHGKLDAKSMNAGGNSGGSNAYR